MTSDAQTGDPRRGHAIRGSDTTWSRRRLAAQMSISELAAASGLPRSVVGLIDQGRLIPKPSEESALTRALESTATA